MINKPEMHFLLPFKNAMICASIVLSNINYIYLFIYCFFIFKIIFCGPTTYLFMDLFSLFVRCQVFVSFHFQASCFCFVYLCYSSIRHCVFNVMERLHIERYHTQSDSILCAKWNKVNRTFLPEICI